jgi:hypothetical protein
MQKNCRSSGGKERVQIRQINLRYCICRQIILRILVYKFLRRS